MSADYVVGEFHVRPTERRVLLHGQPVALGARAFDLLLALIEHRDRVIGKEELLALVWPAVVVEEGNLPVKVSTLRKLLGGDAIATIPGRGYRWARRLRIEVTTGRRLRTFDAAKGRRLACSPTVAAPTTDPSPARRPTRRSPEDHHERPAQR